MALIARRGPSLAERLAEFFTTHPHTWHDGVLLGTVAGRYGWRSRISDIRRPPFSMVIENRQRQVRSSRGELVTVSEYRYLPPAADTPEIAADSDWTLTP